MPAVKVQGTKGWNKRVTACGPSSPVNGAGIVHCLS